MRKKVLWIEDQAELDLAALTVPFYTSGEYHLDVAKDASDAWEKIKKYQYDVVIVDIRIPPGNNKGFIQYFKDKGSDSREARLGIQLLYLLLCPEKNPEKDKIKMRLENIPGWLSKEKFGIITVDSYEEVYNDLNILNIHTYRQKKGISDKTLLLNLVKEIINPKQYYKK